MLENSIAIFQHVGIFGVAPMHPPLTRVLQIPRQSFFLFGPRGTGKSTWLRAVLPHAVHLDLLDASLSLELTRDPHRLEALLLAKGATKWVVLDEVQKIPALLEEVHRLMAGERWNFALCGSSARKLRRGGADMLAGRAVTRHMEGFCSAELGTSFDPMDATAWGTLPLVRAAASQDKADMLRAYVNTYIREEIKEEGIVRKVAPFLRFIEVAGMLNGQVINASNIARDAGVPRSSVDGYFSILQDTLVGHLLPAYQPTIKVRERTHPKFYWFDPGVALAAANLLSEPADRAWMGFAFETLLFHELRVANMVQDRHRPLGYYRTAAGVEIDFVIEKRRRRAQSPPRVVLVEAKLADRWDRAWDRPMRDLARSQGIEVEAAFGVYTGTRAYRFDGVDVLPVADFLARLHDGSVL